jgi:hypothetical protein
MGGLRRLERESSKSAVTTRESHMDGLGSNEPIHNFQPRKIVIPHTNPWLVAARSR